MFSTFAITMGLLAVAQAPTPARPVAMQQQAQQQVQQQAAPPAQYYGHDDGGYAEGGCLNGDCDGGNCQGCNGGACGGYRCPHDPLRCFQCCLGGAHGHIGHCCYGSCQPHDYGNCPPVISSACGGYTLNNGSCYPRGYFLSPCNMPGHHTYFPQTFGYYYFRPYNYTMIRPQQNIVVAWGGDKRHPYDTRFVFDKVYAEMEAEGLIEKELTPEEKAPELFPMPKPNPGQQNPGQQSPAQQAPAEPKAQLQQPGGVDAGAYYRRLEPSVVHVEYAR